MECKYDKCHNFEAGSHNAKYCLECGCKRKRENALRSASRPIPTDEAVWQAQDDRKLSLAIARREKNEWLRNSRSFAMFDIEASNLDADFGEILCACIRPWGGKTTTIALPSFERGDDWRLISDGEIVGAIRDELAKYDYIVTWYGTKFDMPYLTTRLIANGEPTLGYANHIDLYYTSRWKLKLHSNRLASVGDFLFGKTKKDSIVGRIWLSALRGDKDALEYIIKHCKKDVIELERVWEDLLPYRDVAGTAMRFY